MVNGNPVRFAIHRWRRRADHRGNAVLRTRCCPRQASRRGPRSIYEGARDMARQIARSREGRTSRPLRKKIEMLFAHLKRILKLDRLRYEAQMARVTNSSAQPPPRTFARWPS
jgi:hypothetical protein